MLYVIRVSIRNHGLINALGISQDLIRSPSLDQNDDKELSTTEVLSWKASDHH